MVLPDESCSQQWLSLKPSQQLKPNACFVPQRSSAHLKTLDHCKCHYDSMKACSRKLLEAVVSLDKEAATRPINRSGSVSSLVGLEDCFSKHILGLIPFGIIL